MNLGANSWLFLLATCQFISGRSASSPRAAAAKSPVDDDAASSSRLIEKLVTNVTRYRRQRDHSKEKQTVLNSQVIANDVPTQFCGETLYYVVEYYCVYVKRTGVYVPPDNDLDSVSVLGTSGLGKREAISSHSPSSEGEEGF